MEHLGIDIRNAVREIYRAPRASLTVAASIGLALSANLVFFGILNALLLKSLPVADPDRLVVVTEDGSPQFTNPVYEEIRRRQHVFDGVLAWFPVRLDLASSGQTDIVNGLYVSGGYFQTLGVHAGRGRLLELTDDRPSSARAAVISYQFWHQRYGESDVLGRPIEIEGHSFTIVGVTERAFTGLDVGQSFDVAIPIATERVIAGAFSRLNERGVWWLNVMGRLKPGVSIEDANRALNSERSAIRTATVPTDWPAEDLAQFMQGPFVLENGSTGLSSVRQSFSSAVRALDGIALLVLLVACANVANVLLAKGAARRSDLLVRMALGGSRFRLIRGIVVESVILAVVGAAIGLLVSVWFGPILVKQMSTRFGAVTLDLSLDWRVLAFTTGCALITGLACGVVPAVFATSGSFQLGHSGSRRIVESHSRFSATKMLVLGQVSVAFMLVMGAALFVRTFIALTSMNPGFQRKFVTVAEIDLRRGDTAVDARAAVFDQIRDFVSRRPEVQADATCSLPPFTNAVWNGDVETLGGAGSASLNRVSVNYFTTLGIPMLAGRDFSPSDTLAAPRVAIVNRAFVRAYFATGEPIGKSFHYRNARAVAFEVVGVVGDTKSRSLRDPARPAAYLPAGQDARPGPTMALLLRTRGNASAFVTKDILDTITAVAPRAAVSLHPLEQDIGRSIQQERMLAVISALFGGIALSLAVVGLWGLVAFSVERRRLEFGIRAALGATPASLHHAASRDTITIVFYGLAIGLLGSWLLTRLISSLFFDVATVDPLSVAISIAVMGGSAAAAAFTAGRRASSWDPSTLLR